ncbi:MAG: regulatory protein RecX [Proteobacteria bacterium]|jgi:regulatory protein|nr:RecX family transcriptional regulator [Alphaproteobacteria bacterium]NCC03866.1 regulatory protein RecX [Pseudomonadota bacterium]
MAVSSSKPRTRKYRKPTPERLANIALYYLSRYAASEASLRRVLENRIRRAAMADEFFAADKEAHQALRQAIDRIVETHKTSGAINDAAFAETKVRSLRRAGGSARKITEKLRQKGVSAQHIEKALVEDEAGDPAELEAEAATAFARKRRLGPYRSVSKEQGLDEAGLRSLKAKEFAAMMRAGFAYDVAASVLKTSLADEIE